MNGFDNHLLSVYLVTDRGLSKGRSIGEVVEEAVRGGVTMVQLREKECSDKEFVNLGKELKAVLKPYGVPLIINDNVDVAMACDADGVHLGQSDMSPAQARKLLGPDKIIGLSVENFDQVQQAQSSDVDYIAASPVYSTATKTDTRTEFGPEGVRKMVRMSSHPVVGIGSMNEKTAPDVILAGAEGVAVVSAIVSADDPRRAAERIAEAVASARMERTIETGGTVRWSTLAALSVRDILWRIERESFFTEMKSGRLKYHFFNDFMVQNELLLRHYIRLLRYMDVRTESSSDVLVNTMVRHLLDETAADTSDMHTFYLVDTSRLKTDSISPSCAAFVEYLDSHVRTSPLHVALAAMISVPMVSSGLGCYLEQHSDHESNRYIGWINLYSSQEYLHDVEKFSEVVDSVANSVSLHQRVRMLRVFRRAANMELEIWKSLK